MDDWKRAEQKKQAYVRANEVLGNLKSDGKLANAKAATVSRASGAPNDVLVATFRGDMGEKSIVPSSDAFYVLNIKNVDTVGKDQAISIMTERLSSVTNVDAYVFLDAKYYVNSDFLANVNTSLQTNHVITGAVNLICKDELSLIDNIKYNYNQYKNNFIQKSRARLGLSTLINSDALVIRKQIIDAIGSVNFKNVNEELKYTLLLAKLNCKCMFDANVKVYLDIEHYDMHIPSLSKRFSMFINGIKQLGFKNKSLSELICSMVAPNCLTVLIGYLFLGFYSYKYYFSISLYVIAAMFAVLAISFCTSLLNTKIFSKGHLYLFAYPFYSFCRVVYNFPPLKLIRNLMFGRAEAKKIEKLMVNGEMVDLGELNFTSTANDNTVMDYRMHKAQFENFINGIEGKEKILVDCYEGKKALAIIQKVYKTSKEEW